MGTEHGAGSTGSSFDENRSETALREGETVPIFAGVGGCTTLAERGSA